MATWLNNGTLMLTAREAGKLEGMTLGLAQIDNEKYGGLHGFVRDLVAPNKGSEVAEHMRARRKEKETGDE